MDSESFDRIIHAIDRCTVAAQAFAASEITGSGTANTITMFSAGKVIGNSIITQDVGATTVTITGALSVTGHTTVEGITSTGATGTTKFVFSLSPALTGNPTAPTQISSDNSTKIATTAFVTTAVGNGVVADSLFLYYNFT